MELAEKIPGIFSRTLRRLRRATVSPAPREGADATAAFGERLTRPHGC